MAVSFFKYQGTGNDFVIIDNRDLKFPKNNTKLVAQMCNRKFGIGADGLILLEDHDSLDFKMVYFNADGAEGSFCGNGARCITHFAKFLGIVDNTANFEAADGFHQSQIDGDEVVLKMSNVAAIEEKDTHVFLDTGSPHHVELVENLSDFDVFSRGREIRYELYGVEGANVNFVEKIGTNRFAVRTYERGVENETLSCGTGVTAVAVAMGYLGELSSTHSGKAIEVGIKSMGGDLRVQYTKNGSQFVDVNLIGPAVQVFKGIWE